MNENKPNGFVLSEAANYGYSVQDYFDNILSFAMAIPDYLKPIFLVPVYVNVDNTNESHIRVASRIAQIVSDGNSDVSELFSYQTFVNYDNENTTPSDDDESMFADLMPDKMTKDQSVQWDFKNWEPFTTSYMTDVDSRNEPLNGYPYDTPYQVQHSSIHIPEVIRLSATSVDLLRSVPQRIEARGGGCDVNYISHIDKPNHTLYTFEVTHGGGSGKFHNVNILVDDRDNVALVCDCPAWRYGSPEHNAYVGGYLYGKGRGTKTKPTRYKNYKEHTLCKHAYAALLEVEKYVEKAEAEKAEIEETTPDKIEPKESVNEILHKNEQDFQKSIGEPGPKEEIEEKSYQGEPISEFVVNENMPESTEEPGLEKLVNENLVKPNKYTRYKAPSGNMGERLKKLRGKLDLKVPKTRMTFDVKQSIMIIKSDYDW